MKKTSPTQGTLPKIMPESLYFDIIRSFGLRVKGKHIEIPLKFGNESLVVRGNHKDVKLVCKKALGWLKARGWKSETEKLHEGTLAAAHAITNTLVDSLRLGKAEVVFAR